MNNGNLDFDNHMSEILKESFKNTRKFYWRGVFALLFYFSSIFTLLDLAIPLLFNGYQHNLESTSATGSDNDFKFGMSGMGANTVTDPLGQPFVDNDSGPSN